MKVFKSLDEIKNIEATATALGNFDGVHLGHQELIREAVKQAREKGLKSAVFTFSNHPKNVISGTNMVKNIIYNDEKEEILESMGVDYLFSLDYTKEFGSLSPQEFTAELLVKHFRVKHVVCGFNYRYGYKAQGDSQTLIQQGCILGFDVSVMDAVSLEGSVVSSTLIRGLIAQGEMEECSRYLGRNYSIGGTVIEGNHIGRTIGFPTCNITVDETMVAPASGVYVTCCRVDGQTYPAITNVGSKPTIGLYHKNVETHLLDVKVDLYGKDIRVEFLKKLRDERKFDNIEALTEEIRRNCDTAREYHKLLKKQ
ncbi:MAG: bifunctional riboflavin kinase/FAD synthetase [Firmicutes bacterium]|nr:bifunctional riboflavin kinase/FAD synthetase [Bacillota bacterium]MBR6501786.1 bifunctional riboflavin kinase/FAD synthetase [Bacillota bacterium]